VSAFGVSERGFIAEHLFTHLWQLKLLKRGWKARFLQPPLKRMGRSDELGESAALARPSAWFLTSSNPVSENRAEVGIKGLEGCGAMANAIGYCIVLVTGPQLDVGYGNPRCVDTLTASREYRSERKPHGGIGLKKESGRGGVRSL